MLGLVRLLLRFQRLSRSMPRTKPRRLSWFRSLWWRTTSEPSVSRPVVPAKFVSDLHYFFSGSDSVEFWFEPASGVFGSTVRACQGYLSKRGSGAWSPAARYYYMFRCSCPWPFFLRRGLGNTGVFLGRIQACMPACANPPWKVREPGCGWVFGRWLGYTLSVMGCNRRC